MRNSRLKVSISGRFTGPSHFASLAASTTTEMAKSCSFEPSSAAISAASRIEGRPNSPRRAAPAARIRRMAERRAHDGAERPAGHEARHPADDLAPEAQAPEIPCAASRLTTPGAGRGRCAAGPPPLWPGCRAVARLTSAAEKQRETP